MSMTIDPVIRARGRRAVAQALDAADLIATLAETWRQLDETVRASVDSEGLDDVAARLEGEALDDVGATALFDLLTAISNKVQHVTEVGIGDGSWTSADLFAKYTAFSSDVDALYEEAGASSEAPGVGARLAAVDDRLTAVEHAQQDMYDLFSTLDGQVQQIVSSMRAAGGAFAVVQRAHQ